MSTHSERESASKDLARALSCGDDEVYERMFAAVVDTFGEEAAGEIDDQAAIIAATEEARETGPYSHGDVTL